MTTPIIEHIRELDRQSKRKKYNLMNVKIVDLLAKAPESLFLGGKLNPQLRKLGGVPQEIARRISIPLIEIHNHKNRSIPVSDLTEKEERFASELTTVLIFTMDGTQHDRYSDVNRLFSLSPNLMNDPNSDEAPFAVDELLIEALQTNIFFRDIQLSAAGKCLVKLGMNGEIDPATINYDLFYALTNEIIESGSPVNAKSLTITDVAQKMMSLCISLQQVSEVTGITTYKLSRMDNRKSIKDLKGKKAERLISDKLTSHQMSSSSALLRLYDYTLKQFNLDPAKSNFSDSYYHLCCAKAFCAAYEVYLLAIKPTSPDEKIDHLVSPKVMYSHILSTPPPLKVKVCYRCGRDHFRTQSIKGDLAVLEPKKECRHCDGAVVDRERYNQGLKQRAVSA